MERFIGIGEKFRRFKEVFWTWGDKVVINTIGTQITRVSGLPPEQRKREFEGLVVLIQKAIPESPAIAYYLYGQLGNCYLALEQPQKALEYFGQAIERHPLQIPTSDFPAYVDCYLSAVQAITRLPNKEKQSLFTAADRIEGLIPKLPFLEYKLRGFVGLCYLETGRAHKAVGHFEKALLMHPTPTPDTDFPTYGRNYIVSVQQTSQHAIGNLQGQNRQASINRLIEVIQSTARVAERHPQLEGLTNENHAAFSWLEKTVGPKNIHVNIKKGISNN